MAAGQITGTRKVPRSREGPSRSKYCSDLLFSRPHGWSAAWWIGIPPRLTFDADGLSAGEAAAIDHRHRMSAWDSRIWGADGAPYEEAIPIHHSADQPWGLLKRRSEQYLDLLGPSLQTSRERGTLRVPVIWPAAIRPIRYQSWWKLTHS